MYDIDISYIRRPLLARGHPAAKSIVSYTIYIYMLHLHPLILYDNVSCCMLYSVCCIHPTVCSSVPWKPNCYPPLTGVPGFWVSLMRPWNSLKFQAISNTSQNHQNGSLRLPKNTKMVSRVVPETIQIMKTPKMRDLTKTIAFTILLKGWDIRKPLIFDSKVIKEHACNANHVFHPPNLRIYQKVTQNGLQLGTHNPSKIVTNLPWDSQVTP